MNQCVLCGSSVPTASFLEEAAAVTSVPGQASATRSRRRGEVKRKDQSENDTSQLSERSTYPWLLC